jgi:hypothetical protein
LPHAAQAHPPVKLSSHFVAYQCLESCNDRNLSMGFAFAGSKRG